MARRKTTNEIIQEFKHKHGTVYDYSHIRYVNDYTKVQIICKTHGTFYQTPNNHKRGQHCPKCKIGKQIERSHFMRTSTQHFRENAVKKHGNLYDYSSTNYVNQHTKVQIICRMHGQFEQLPGNHTQGQGCPKCRTSKGETAIRQTLLSLGIDFKEQYRFSDCRYKHPLPFDFYLFNQNILIEFDGKQHFKKGSKFHPSNSSFVQLKHRDAIKTKYAKEHGFCLIRIPFTQLNNVEDILTEKLL